MKLKWRNILCFGAGMLVLFMIPVLILGISGKYRLLMKPRPVDVFKRNMKAISDTVTANNNSFSITVKSNPKEELENILHMYTVDFYYPHMEYPGNPDENNADAVNLRVRKLPVVEIPFSVSRIAGIETDRSYESRIYDVSLLGRNLSDKEITALLYFLHKKEGDDALPLLEFDAIKNDVASAIINQERMPAEFAPHLVAMYYDRSLDDVWRDYCVQFLGQCYDKIENPQERAVVRNLFSDALKDNAGIPGATLIAMAGLADNPEFDRRKIADAAYALCIDTKTDDMIKTTALQICAKFKKNEVLAVARDMIKTSKNVPLKMSAIAAIGAMGNSSDQDTLRSFVRSSDVRLRTASNAALRKIGVN